MTLTESQQEYYIECLIEKEKCEDSYLEFFKRGWGVLEPSNPLIMNWHIEYLCGLLQVEVERIAKGEFKTLDYIINIAPRSLKSKIFNVFLCPWVWTKYPHFKFINNSFEAGLATSLCLESRRLIDSDWYQRYWGNMFHLSTDQNVKSWYDNDKRGMRRSASTRGGVTGTGADIIINDDPQDPNMGESEAERSIVKEHHGKTLYTRLNNKRVGLRIIIQQRLHEDDLTGYLMENNPELYHHICIPGEETDDISPPALRKYYKDGLFFPQNPSFTRESLHEARLETNLGEIGYAGQILQSPSPLEGNIFKRKHWKFWKPKGVRMPPVVIKTEDGPISIEAVDLPDKFDDKVCGWDMAFKDTKGSDEVSGQIWSKLMTGRYLLDNHTAHMDYPKTREAVIELRARQPNISAVYVEDRANGSAIIADLKLVIPGLIPVSADRSTGGKVARALPYSKDQQAGNVYLPHPSLFPWVWKFIEEHASFPNGKADNQVDAAAHSNNNLSEVVKRVIPSYDYQNNLHFREFKIQWNKIDHRHKFFVSVWERKDLTTGVILSLWDAIGKHLYVFHELVSQRSSPELIVPVLVSQFNNIIKDCKDKLPPKEQNKIRINLLKNFDWVGNQLMFGKPVQDSVADQYSEFKVMLSENVGYDDMGSLTELNYLWHKNKITLHRSCEKTSEHLCRWAMDNNQPEGLSGNKNISDIYFAQALCNIVNLLIGMEQFKMPKLKAYTKISNIYQDKADKAIEQNQVAEFNTGTFEDKTQENNKNSWMST